MEENERSETVLEESAQETSGKKSLTNDNKISLVLLAVALILWVFAPFVVGDLFKTTALEMLVGPIFQSWDWFTEAFYGDLAYSEYIELMSLSRQFWVAIATVVYILLAAVASLRNNRRNAVVFSALGTVAFLAPMLELGIYVVKTGVTIPGEMLREFLGAFGWGYWAILVIIIAIGFVNRNKEPK